MCFCNVCMFPSERIAMYYVRTVFFGEAARHQEEEALLLDSAWAFGSLGPALSAHAPRGIDIHSETHGLYKISFPPLLFSTSRRLCFVDRDFTIGSSSRGAKAEREAPVPLTTLAPRVRRIRSAKVSASSQPS